MRKIGYIIAVIFVTCSLFVSQFSPVFAQTGGTETPSPTITATETITPTVTVTSTPGIDVSPSATPASSEIIATQTPIQPATQTPPPAETVMPNSTNNEVELTLTSTPDFIFPNSKVTLHWEIQGQAGLEENLSPKSNSSRFSIQFFFSEDVTPEKQKGVKYNEKDHSLTVQINQKQGQIQFNLQNLTSDRLGIEAVLFDKNDVLTKASLTLTSKEEFTLSAFGGEVNTDDGKIKIGFPNGVLADDAIIQLGAPSGDAVPEYSLSGRPFEIKAHEKKSGADLNKFNKEIKLEVSYADLNIPDELQGELYLYWYNPETKNWEGMMSQVDPKTKTVWANTKHFSVFDIGVNNWQATILPTVDTFQVASFTGAATFSLPIDLPAGPGGFKPNLTLSYNSQVVDQSTVDTQASWVGMGWSLDNGSISRDTHGTTDNTGDDTFMLSVGGVSTRVAMGVDGIWHALDENFWRIQYDQSANTWTVWDKNGNSYYFGDSATENVDATSYMVYPNGNQMASIAYLWSLRRARNSFGKEIQYKYTQETKTLTSMGQSYVADTAVYPASIIYANAGYKIWFEVEARNDYIPFFPSDGIYHNYQRSRLKTIHIYNWNGSAWSEIKNYTFTYNENNQTIFPGVHYTSDTNPASWRKMTTLTGVQETAIGSPSITLPKYSFTYADYLHLTQGTNGYGGTVEFDYDNDPNQVKYEPWYYPTSGRATWLLEQYFATNALCKFTGTTGGWNATSGTVGCLDDVHGWNMHVNGTAYNPQTVSVASPGNVYNVSAQVVNGSLVTGLHDGGYGYLGPSSSSNVMLNPTYAYKAYPLISAPNGADISYFKMERLPTFYEVKRKTISDGNGNSYTYSYTYAGAAVNDPTHSEMAATCAVGQGGCEEYIEENSEFRGHASVTETGPDGSKTITSYLQTDSQKGTPFNVKRVDASGATISEVKYSYGTQVQELYGGGGPAVGHLKGYWVHPIDQETWVYSQENQSTPQGKTRTEFYYDDATTPDGVGVLGNLTKQVESSWNGSTWTPYHTTKTYFQPNPATMSGPSAVYLTGLPVKTEIYDGLNTLTAVQINLFDGNLSNPQTQPTQGILTATRTWVQGTNDYSQVSYTYDAWGNQTSVTTYPLFGTSNSAPPSTNAQTTSTSYDPTYNTYPLSITNAKNQTTTLTYDYAKGVPLTETSPTPNGAVTTAEYDALGRIRKLFRPLDAMDQPSLEMTYTNSFPFTTMITQRIDGSQLYLVTRVYDGMGRQTRITSGGVSTDTIYESATVTKQSVPYEGTSLNQFNVTENFPATRTTKITAPDGSYSTSRTNAFETKQIDSLGNATTSINDLWGRTTLVTPPTGPAVSYTYDVMGRLKTATRGNLTTTLTYNKAGQKIDMTDPDMGHLTYTYDALGNLLTQKDALNCTLAMGYDPLNRLISKTPDASCSTSQVSTYTYDAGVNGIGRRTSMTDASGSSAWEYDLRGRLIKETKNITGAPSPFVTQYAYNNADLPTAITYPGGEVVNTSYNSRMQVDTVNGTSTYVSSSIYDTAGRMTQHSYGNGTQSAYNYYAWNTQGGRLQSMTSSKGSLTFQSLNYLYDNAGNVTEVQNIAAGEKQIYTYDTLNRLYRWELKNMSNALLLPAESYSYDNTTGNLASKGNNNYTYDANHPHAVKDYGSIGSYTYDANGNMKKRTFGSDISDLTYDAEGHLLTVSGNVPGPSATPIASPTPVAATATNTLPPTATRTPTSTPTRTLTPTATRTPTPIPPIFADVGVSNPYRLEIEAIYRAGITGGCSTSPLNYCPSSFVTRDQMAVFLLRAKYGSSYNPPAVGGSTGFADVPTTHWAAAWIKQLAAEGITSGCGGGNYCPSANVTREQFAIFVLRTKNGSGWNPPSYSSYTYTDIASSSFKNWIQYLKTGLSLTADNCGVNLYCPTASLTRERMAYLLVRVFNISMAEVNSRQAAFNDVPAVSATPSALDIFPSLFPLTPIPGAKVLAMPLQSGISATFVYDGDGNRVKSTIGGVTTFFVGNLYELTGTQETKYYYAGGQRIAMRQGGTLTFMLGDHLGSTSLTTNSSGAVISELRYTPWGEVRTQAGVTATKYTYTGQYSNTADFGLMFYNARWYDPALGRFTSADSIVPAGVQGYDRYAYVNNSPVNFVDPSGHDPSNNNCDYAGVGCRSSRSTPTITPTRTPTIVPTRTSSPTFTPTGTPTSTGTNTNTATNTLTLTSTTTPTAVPTTTLLASTDTDPTADPIQEQAKVELLPYSNGDSTVIPIGWGYDALNFWNASLHTLPYVGIHVVQLPTLPQLIVSLGQIGSIFTPVFSGSSPIIVPMPRNPFENPLNPVIIQ